MNYKEMYMHQYMYIQYIEKDETDLYEQRDEKEITMAWAMKTKSVQHKRSEHLKEHIKNHSIHNEKLKNISSLVFKCLIILTFL